MANDELSERNRILSTTQEDTSVLQEKLRSANAKIQRTEDRLQGESPPTSDGYLEIATVSPFIFTGCTPDPQIGLIARAVRAVVWVAQILGLLSAHLAILPFLYSSELRFAPLFYPPRYDANEFGNHETPKLRRRMGVRVERSSARSRALILRPRTNSEAAYHGLVARVSGKIPTRSAVRLGTKTKYRARIG